MAVDEAEFRGKVLAGLDSLQRQISQNREDSMREIRELKSDVSADMSAIVSDFKQHVDDVVGRLQTEQGVRWEAHVGKRGDHAAMDQQRREDINRVYTVLGILAVVLGGVMAAVGQHVYFAASIAGSISGAFILLAQSARAGWHKVLWGWVASGEK